MVSCADFLRDFSDYRDGAMDPVGSAAMAAHLAGCGACLRYARVIEEGVGQLRAIPAIEPSYDFLPRLQHRIYNLEEERARIARRESVLRPALVLAVLVVLIAAAALWPQREPRLAVVELPPVAATAPKKYDTVHALFRPGPLLAPSVEANRTVNPAANTVFFRYAPLGTYVNYPSTVGYPIQAYRPR